MKGLGVPPHLSFKHPGGYEHVQRIKGKVLYDYLQEGRLAVVSLGLGVSGFSSDKQIAIAVDQALKVWAVRGVGGPIIDGKSIS